MSVSCLGVYIMSENFGVGMAGTNGHSTEAAPSVRGGFNNLHRSTMTDEETEAALAASEQFHHNMEAAKAALADTLVVTKAQVEAIVGPKAWDNRRNRMALAKTLVAKGIFSDSIDAIEWFARN